MRFVGLGTTVWVSAVVAILVVSSSPIGAGGYDHVPGRSVGPPPGLPPHEELSVSKGDLVAQKTLPRGYRWLGVTPAIGSAITNPQVIRHISALVGRQDQILTDIGSPDSRDEKKATVVFFFHSRNAAGQNYMQNYMMKVVVSNGEQCEVLKVHAPKAGW